jgi:ABC-type phosphate transport system auxiliary subunit
MTLICDAFEQDYAYGVASWTELQHRFERLQAVYVQTTSFLQKQRQNLNQQAARMALALRLQDPGFTASRARKPP